MAKTTTNDDKPRRKQLFRPTDTIDPDRLGDQAEGALHFAEGYALVAGSVGAKDLLAFLEHVAEDASFREDAVARLNEHHGFEPAKATPAPEPQAPNAIEAVKQAGVGRSQGQK
jgi:hypothetical protein